MKKLLSIMLVVVMLLTTLMLSSCDFLTNIFNPSSNQDAGRTTITEMEWLNAFNVTNYTMNVQMNGESIITVIAADTKGYINYSGSMNAYIDGEKQIYVMEYDGVYYGVMPEGSSLDGLNFALSEVNFGLLPEIDNLSDLDYNADAKVYTYKDNSMLMELAFLDGKLVSINAVSVDSNYDVKLEVKNVGTTTLEIPEYIDLSDGKVESNNAGASAVTTVTKEQFESAFEISNATITLNMGIQAQRMKYTETASESIYISSGMSQTSRYEVLIDGVWYSLERNYDSQIGDFYYIAKEISYQSNNGLNGLFSSVSFENLVYNAVGRYYEGIIDGMQTYWYFADGQLSQIVVLAPYAGGKPSEVIVTISDVGTTVIDLPEYTIYHDPNAFDEAEWNEMMLTSNFTAEGKYFHHYYDVNAQEMVYEEYNVLIETSENGIKINNLENFEPYIVGAIVDGIMYDIGYNESENRYEGVRNDAFEIMTIASILNLDIDYSKLEYSEYVGSYSYVNAEEGNIHLTIHFKNGIITSLTCYGIRYEGDQPISYFIELAFSNVGTTVVELPEYTIVE